MRGILYAAMQSINVAVINPWFLAPFVGTAAACVLLAVWSLPTLPGAGAVCRLLGSLLYLVGTMLVTLVCNVPRNDALAAVDPASTSAASLWDGYVNSWMAWNHVRTAAALAAAVALVIALLR